MKNSELEKLNDKVLKKIILQIVKICEDDGLNWTRVFIDSSVYDIFESTINFLGLGNDIINIDYIFNLMRLNLITGDLPDTLKRPLIEKYGQEIDVSETLYQTVTYRHIVYSYSRDTVKDQLTFMQDEGQISIFDGEMTNQDVYDSEVNDVKYLNPFKLK